jgi:hypothetical protein
MYISEEADKMFLRSDEKQNILTPSSDDDAFYTPVAHGSRFIDSMAKAGAGRRLDEEIISLSICDILIHGFAEDTSFTTALGLQERVAAVRSAQGLREAQYELNRIVDAFGVAIKGAQENPARLVFLCVQLIALRVCLATMDDIDTRDILELEVSARNNAFKTLWKHTYGALLSKRKGAWDILGMSSSLNGDGERIGRVWVAMFQFAKVQLGVDRVANTGETGHSSKPLLMQLQNGILKDLLLKLDSSMLEILTSGVSDADINALTPGGGNLTFSAGAELKRAISALSSIAIKFGIGPNVDVLIPELRATADVCMIPKDALVDAKLRSDIVCGKLSNTALLRIIERFKPDDFAPQQIDPAIADAIISSIPDGENLDINQQQYTPARTDGASWIANLARALSKVEGAVLRDEHIPDESTHASRWSLVSSSLRMF